MVGYVESVYFGDDGGVALRVLRLHFFRGVPIHQRGGDFFPVSLVNAVVAHAVAIYLIFPDQLEAAVFEH